MSRRLPSRAGLIIRSGRGRKPKTKPRPLLTPPASLRADLPLVIEKLRVEYFANPGKVGKELDGERTRTVRCQPVGVRKSSLPACPSSPPPRLTRARKPLDW